MTGSLPDLALYPSLRELHLRSNHFNGTIPQGLGQLSKLKIVEVSFNRLQGSPESLGQLFNLESFDAPYNLLEGTISESHLSNHRNLKSLDLSSNPLTWNVCLDFQLQVIRLSSSNLGPLFPKWLQTQNSYSFLDLSINIILDTMPSWFPKSPSTLYSLNLSYNQISGKIHDLSANNALMVIDFSINKFSGPLPKFPKLISQLRVDNNQFYGSLNFICTLRSPTTLDLSVNLLSGEIPDCWTAMSVPMVLNVANNNISGSIPYSLCSSISSLSALYVCNHYLSGQFPASLKNCQGLKVLDLGRNTLSGKIPEWIATKLAYLGLLSLRFNKFSGSIPPSICQLQSIQILDLCGNHLSGRIPKCFSNFTTLQLLHDGSSVSYDFDPYVTRAGILYHGNALVQWKNKESEYRNTLWLLKTIDLSSNELVGDIPKDFSRMNALLSLNLSRNNLTGNIIEGIGLMKMLESLDLSTTNQPSGKIPIGLANLTFLSVLHLSNNFSGRIPSSTQLQGFDSSSYGGPPLPECPMFAPPNAHVGYDSNASSTSQENDDEFPSKEFYISMALSFIVAFCGIWGSLMFNNSWSNAYFKWFHGHN